MSTPTTDHDWFDRLLARTRLDRVTRLRILAALPEGPLLLADRHVAGYLHLVSRDPYHPVAWRVTRLDADGLVGHGEAPTFRDACETAAADGADLATARPVTPATVDEVADAMRVEPRRNKDVAGIVRVTQ